MSKSIIFLCLPPGFVLQPGKPDPDVYRAFCRLARFNDRSSLAFERANNRAESFEGEHLEALYVSSYYGLYSLCVSLQAAVYCRSEKLVLLLLQHGTDVNAQGGIAEQCVAGGDMQWQWKVRLASPGARRQSQWDGETLGHCAADTGVSKT